MTVLPALHVFRHKRGEYLNIVIFRNSSPVEECWIEQSHLNMLLVITFPCWRICNSRAGGKSLRRCEKYNFEAHNFPWNSTDIDLSLIIKYAPTHSIETLDWMCCVSGENLLGVRLCRSISAVHINAVVVAMGNTILLFPDNNRPFRVKSVVVQ